MSDTTPPNGDQVEEPTVDDVVERAHDSLAHAEAAGHDAVPDAPAAGAAADVPWYERDDVPLDPEPAAASPAAAATEVLPEHAPTDAVPVDAAAATVAAAVTSSEPPAAVVTPAEVAAAAPVQPVFVQAPEPPQPRGNRAAAAGIGILASVVYAALYLAARLCIDLVNGSVGMSGLGARALNTLGTMSMWVPVVVFFLAFWLLGAIINRGRWGYWVVFGLLVGAASYGGHILGALVQAPFWTLTASEGAKLASSQLLVPLSIAAFVIGRELTIWFGAWVARRGKRMSELNYEAQREYERTIEAGPTIVRPAQG